DGALAKEPKQRFSDSTAFLAALRQALPELFPQSERPLPAGRQLTARRGATGASSRPAWQSRPALFGAGLALLVLALAFGWWRWPRPDGAAVASGPGPATAAAGASTATPGPADAAPGQPAGDPTAGDPL